MEEIKDLFASADNLEDHPVVAYHFRLYAVMKGLELCKSTSYLNPQQRISDKALISSKLAQLEQSKQNIPPSMSKQDMQAEVESFLLQ